MKFWTHCTRPVTGMLIVCVCVALALGCKSGASTAAKPPAEPPFMSAVAGPPPVAAGQEAPPADKTGGFDGKRAYDQVAKQVSYGPRPAGSPALAKLQDYLETELKSYGCTVETDSFSADTPAGRLPMKNFLVKIPGQKPGIILLGTHYDTKRLDNFVGADDAGSSTGVMLELARLLCRQPTQKYAVWITFFDGEEAVNPQWKDPDNRYGSRQMAAKLAASGDLKNVRAFILADLVGANNLLLKPEENSTKALSDLVWKIAAQLGYQNIFVNEPIAGISDDHLSFLSRKVPSADLINLNTSTSYWHTPQDTMDKISPKSLAIVGYVLLETIKQLQQQ
jgi:Zn-dependent M28 family amino/carboxypeptidase